MRLTLDWDSEEIKDTHLPAVAEREPADASEAQTRISAFLEDADPDAATQQSDQLELWQSSGGEGYHYLEYDLDLDLTRIRQLRQIYGDDQTRISLDGTRIQEGSPYVSVLYHMKEIKPREHKPYSTDKRAELLVREGFDESTTVETKDDETGRLRYDRILEALADHPDFGNRAALIRRLQRRDSVNVTTEPAKRGYDIAKGRRSPTRAEAKALSDYASSREIGHYSDGTTEQPAELAAKPSRTTFHEYFEVPEIDFDTPPGEGESEWLPANLRTGTWSDEIDETTLKQVHDRIAEQLTDTLSPKGGIDGLEGFTLDRFDYAISLERDRPIDRDETARFRRVFVENQPFGGSTQPLDALEYADFYDAEESGICWELIVYNEDYKGTWWIARGVLDVSDGDVTAPVARSKITADTQNFL